MPSTSRRRFILSSSVAAAATAGSGCGDWASEEESTERWEPKLAQGVADLRPDTLRWIAQLGLKYVALEDADWVDREGKGYWSPEDIALVRQRCAEHGLELHSLMLPLDWLTSPMLALADRDLAIDEVQRSVQTAGRAGVRVIEWRWSPDLIAGDAALYQDAPGRGGSVYRRFDYDAARSLPPLEGVGDVSREDLWDRLVYFALPVAEAAQEVEVGLALRPSAPPAESVRGVARVLTDVESMEKLLDAVDLPANGLSLCQGAVAAAGGDVLDAIRRLGARERIHHVRFGSVRGSMPQYVETFIDDGDLDPLEAMRVYKEINYAGSMVADRAPRLQGAFHAERVGGAYAHGYLRGLVQAVNEPV